LPPQAGLSNPIDMIASAPAEHVEEAIGLVGRDPNVDAVVAIYVPVLVTRPEDIASAIARGAAAVPHDKPVATVFMSSKGTPHRWRRRRALQGRRVVSRRSPMELVPELVELDINPVAVLECGAGAFAVDARMRLS
jgi:acyl-CoA synthetase (NDP forming)